MVKRIFFIAVLSVLFFSASKAQDIQELMNDTATIHADAAPAQASPTSAYKWNQIHTKYFTLNFGIALLLDHSFVNQDATNIEQVGKIEPATEFRGERLVFSGNLLFFKYPWRYMISLNYNGLDQPVGKQTFSIIDLNLEIPLGAKAGWITLGKQKEGVGFEYILPGTQGMFMERGSGVPAFVRQRNIGIRYSNTLLGNRASFTAGVFNSWTEYGNTHNFSTNGIQVTSRLTALPLYESDRTLVHIGLGYRYTQATDSNLSYKAKPEDNAAPYFINTGSFPASGAQTVMLEWLGVSGPVSLLAEYMNTYVNSTATGNPVFHYWQVAASWFITGENRRYNKQIGATGKLIPKKNFWFTKGSGPGAFELGARYTRSDFISGSLDGGKFSRVSGAFSWYPNTHFRFEINYGYGKLEKNELIGKVDIWQFRVQFEL